jgi:hypothetical protein
VSVAAGVNGNAPVALILPGRCAPLTRGLTMAAINKAKRPRAGPETERITGTITSTGAFPFTRAATIKGVSTLTLTATFTFG